MLLKYWTPKNATPSRSGGTPVDMQSSDALGNSLQTFGKAISGLGEDFYALAAPERAALRQQEAHRVRLEEDLTVQEKRTEYEVKWLGRRDQLREGYLSGALGNERNITDFAKNATDEMKALLDDKAFVGLPSNVKSRLKVEIYKYWETQIPELNKMRTELLVSRSEARLGQAKVKAEHLVNQASSADGVVKAIAGHNEALYGARQGGTLSDDKMEERGNKFATFAAESWWNAQLGKDSEALLRAMRNPTEAEDYLFGFINGKDRKQFSEERQRQVLDKGNADKKEAERKVKDEQNAAKNDLWDSFFRSPKSATFTLSDDQNIKLKKLPEEDYKAIVKFMAEYYDRGGMGDEKLKNETKVKLLKSSTALSDEAILKLPGLNYPQQQELYQTKRSQASAEAAAASNAKHWSHDPHYVFYDQQIGEQLGIVKLSELTKAADVQVLSQAIVAYRIGYERLHTEKKGQVSQQEARDLMEGIIVTARKDLSFAGQPKGDADRYLDIAELARQRKAGEITPSDYTQGIQKLKAQRSRQQAEEAQARASSGMTPKKDFKKRGKE